MVTTPLITKIKTEGGTLYTFTSASKDLTRVWANGSEYNFKFSHFACLNLPFMMDGNTTMMDYYNYVDGKYFEYVKSYIVEDTFTIKIKIEEKQRPYIKSCKIHLLNKNTTYDPIKSNDEYSINFENVRDGETLKFKILLTFDNGAKDLETDVLEYVVNYVGNDFEKGLYLKSFKYDTTNTDPNFILAEHFQNYILNFESVLLNQETFDSNILRTPAERIFFSWLRKAGGIRFVDSGKRDGDGKFGYIEDVSRYYETTDKYLDRTVQYLGNIDVINQADINGDTFGEVYMYIPGSVGATPEIYFRAINDNNYKQDIYRWNSEKIVGRENFALENRPIDEISLDAIYDQDISSNYYMGDEGFSIDWRDENTYSRLYSDTLSELNGNSYINFEFNCVLVYYDLINTQTGEYATNLYGVFFLEEYQQDEINKHLGCPAKPYPKFRSSELEDGNAYALKIDIKVDTAPTTTLSYKTNTDEIENDNDATEYAMYNQALEQLQKCIDIFYTQQNEIYRLQDRVEELESILYTMGDVKKLETDIQIINDRLDANGIVDTSTIMDVVSQNSNTLNKIIAGKYPTKLAIDKSKLNLSDGLSFVETGDDSINIKNTLQKYAIAGRVSLNPSTTLKDVIVVDKNNVNVTLHENSNLLLLSENENGDSNANKYGELIFTIDATDVQWKRGQSFIFAINDNFTFNKIKHESLTIKTVVDSTINVGSSTDTITVKKFINTDMTNLKNKTEIEIVCIDDDFNTTGDKFITIIR